MNYIDFVFIINFGDIMNIEIRLFEALKELANNEDFNSLNVSMLCKKAGIHRQTFYKHYNTKFDFIEPFFNYLIKENFNFNGEKLGNLLVDFICLLNNQYNNFIINNEYVSSKLLILLDKLINNIILEYDETLTKSEMILAIGGIKNYLYLMLYHPNDFNSDIVKDNINDFLDKLNINKIYRGD